jgi:putative ABC transport system permease protein
VRFVLNLIADLSQAGRLVRRNAALSMAAILCFALGIGANTSIFSVVNAVLFRPLPFADASRIVLISQGFSGQTADFGRVNAADYVDFRAAEGGALAAVALIEGRSPLLTGAGDPERVPGAAVTPSLFRVLGVRPVLGRTFVDSDAEPGAPAVAMLSGELWRRRYGADPDIVGRKVDVYPNRTVEIVGVMPPDFVFPLPGLGLDAGELLFPLGITPALIAARGERYDWLMIGRLSENATIDRARTSLAAVAAQFRERYPEIYAQAPPSLGDPVVNVTPLRDAVVGEARRPLLLLLGAVGFVLLIACANVASLVIARATERRREIAIRRALGASRARLWQQFFAETLVLVCLGAGIGIWIAVLGGDALAAAAPGDFYRSFDVSVDARVLGFTIAVTTFVALLFSILPAIYTARADVHLELRDGSHSVTGGRVRRRGLRSLVIAEIALAMVLTIGAALMVRSFAKVHAADPGFAAGTLMTFGVNLPPSRYPDPAQLPLVQEQIAHRLRELPGVEAASGTTHFPLAGLWRIVFTPGNDASGTTAIATNARVLPEFFETLQIPLLAGRTFTPRDGAGTPSVAIVSETLALRHFGTRDAVGQQLIWGDPNDAASRITIVGVVADVKQARLDEVPQASVYMPRLQDNRSELWRFTRYVVRTNAATSDVIARIRHTIHDHDPQLLVLEFTDVRAAAAATIADRQFTTLLFTLFAVLALALAATGIYGLMQYMVARRTREVGIRVALGARSADIMRLVLGEGLRLLVLGIVFGLCGAFVLTRFLESMLFETGRLDAQAFAASSLVLVLATLIAICAPLRHALRVQPLGALRTP